MCWACLSDTIAAVASTPASPHKYVTRRPDVPSRTPAEMILSASCTVECSQEAIKCKDIAIDCAGKTRTSKYISNAKVK